MVIVPCAGGGGGGREVDSVEQNRRVRLVKFGSGSVSSKSESGASLTVAAAGHGWISFSSPTHRPSSRKWKTNHFTSTSTSNSDGRRCGVLLALPILNSIQPYSNLRRSKKLPVGTSPSPSSSRPLYSSGSTGFDGVGVRVAGSRSRNETDLHHAFPISRACTIRNFNFANNVDVDVRCSAGAVHFILHFAFPLYIPCNVRSYLLPPLSSLLFSPILLLSSTPTSPLSSGYQSPIPNPIIRYATHPPTRPASTTHSNIFLFTFVSLFSLFIYVLTKFEMRIRNRN